MEPSSHLYQSWLDVHSPDDSGDMKNVSPLAKRVKAFFRLLDKSTVAGDSCCLDEPLDLGRALVLAESIRNKIGEVTNDAIVGFICVSENIEMLIELERLLVATGIRISQDRSVQSLLNY